MDINILILQSQAPSFLSYMSMVSRLANGAYHSGLLAWTFSVTEEVYRTIYGTMDDKELVALFRFAAIIFSSLVLFMISVYSGYGYQVRFVEDLDNIDLDLAASIEWAISEIHKIQKAARSGNPIVKPRWPVLILRTIKVRESRFILSVSANRGIFYYRAGEHRKPLTVNILRDHSTRTKSPSRPPRNLTSNSRSSTSGSPRINRANCLPKTASLWVKC